jgi:hypothetical protein
MDLNERKNGGLEASPSSQSSGSQSQKDENKAVVIGRLSKLSGDGLGDTGGRAFKKGLSGKKPGAKGPEEKAQVEVKRRKGSEKVRGEENGGKGIKTEEKTGERTEDRTKVKTETHGKDARETHPPLGEAERTDRVAHSEETNDIKQSLKTALGKKGDQAVEEKTRNLKRVVKFGKGEDTLDKIKKLPNEIPEESPAGGEGKSKGKKGKYQHKQSVRPPKRVRKILSRANPEVLQKLEELLELERTHNPEAAKAREEREKRREELREQKPLGKPKINKKTQRYMKKYGISVESANDNQSTKKILSYKLMFAYSPIEEMTDKEALANIRLLFLAHSDHNVPKTMDKFVTYMKNNMCFGISDEQLDRVIKLLVDNNYLVLVNDKLSMNLDIK